jgi:LytS/YehU family sensor histidine kinase
LIEEDKDKAQEFLDEFSHIYRYVLETIDKSVVSLKEELNFAESYIFLQKMRYGQNLNFDVRLNSEILNHYLPPLSLQLVLENAIKHNIISKEKELKIELSNDLESIIITNNLQAKTSKYKSTSLGQKNLVKRYSLISNLKPEFYIKSTKYIAKLPILKINL